MSVLPMKFASRILSPSSVGGLRRSVRVHPAEEVTTIGERELPPEAGGLTTSEIDRIWDAVKLYYRSGIQPAIALCIRRHGKIVMDRAIGHARGNSPGAPHDCKKELATPDHLYNLFSGSKPITAMLMHHLDDAGLIHIDDTVSEYIPEFAAHGKQNITIRHLLNHTAGIPTTTGMMDLDFLKDPALIRALYCGVEAESSPGRSLAYHAITSGFVFADIIKEVTGKDIQTYLNEVVRAPLGFENLAYGVPEAKLPRVARDVFTGFAQIPPASTIFERGFGAPIETVVGMARDERYLRAVVPSGNIIGTPSEIGRFFELILREGELDGTRVFESRTVRRATRETSYGQFDKVIMLPIRYGSGFMLGGKYLSLYGANTEEAFGHLGFTNICAWADPARDISVALMTTGKPLITPGLVAWLNVAYTISSAIPRIR